MQIEISSTTGIEIRKLIDSIPEFEPTSIEEIQKRMDGRKVTLFKAKENSEIVGFIVAYNDSQNVYYNWLTGVFPDYRGKSNATLLFKAFEEYAKQNGCETCRVKSMVKFEAMLNLLSNRNYMVVGKTDEKIIFEKKTPFHKA